MKQQFKKTLLSKYKVHKLKCKKREIQRKKEVIFKKQNKILKMKLKKKPEKVGTVGHYCMAADVRDFALFFI